MTIFTLCCVFHELFAFRTSYCEFPQKTPESRLVASIPTVSDIRCPCWMLLVSPSFAGFPTDSGGPAAFDISVVVIPNVNGVPILRAVTVTGFTTLQVSLLLLASMVCWRSCCYFHSCCCLLVAPLLLLVPLLLLASLLLLAFLVLLASLLLLGSFLFLMFSLLLAGFRIRIRMDPH